MARRKRSARRRHTTHLRIEPLEPRLTLSAHPLMALMEAHDAMRESDGAETEAQTAMVDHSSSLQTENTAGSVATSHDQESRGGQQVSEGQNSEAEQEDHGSGGTQGTGSGQESDEDHGGQGVGDDHEAEEGQKAQAPFTQTNLVSNSSSISAAHQDTNLVNPMGIVRDATTGTSFVADNASGTITQYDPAGVASSTVITVPSPTPGVNGTPTALVLNHGADLALKDGSASQLIVATQNGTIAAWGPSLTNHTAQIEVDNSASGAVYTGLTTGRTGDQTLLYAADFHNGTVDVFDAHFTKVTTLAGNFIDPGTDPLPTLPSGATGFAPFGISNIDGKLYVAFAAQDGAGHKVTGTGAGFIDVFNTDGTFDRRLATGAALNAPWGLALAPEGFGGAEHVLIVGNAGDGTLSAFNLQTGTSLGQLKDSTGAVITIDGLWGLAWGGSMEAGHGQSDREGDALNLFFVAGPNGGSNGLFGTLAANLS
jgi:uncharacterized protein (TIGR03118 family)